MRNILDECLHDHMTSAVLKAAKKDPTHETVYFDDFVGDGDRDLLNRTKVQSGSIGSLNRNLMYI